MEAARSTEPPKRQDRIGSNEVKHRPKRVHAMPPHRPQVQPGKNARHLDRIVDRATAGSRADSDRRQMEVRPREAAPLPARSRALPAAHHVQHANVVRWWNTKSMQRAPDQTKAQTHQVHHVASRHPMPHETRWPGQANEQDPMTWCPKPFARQQVFLRAPGEAWTAGSATTTGGVDRPQKDELLRRRWRGFLNRKGTPHTTPFPKWRGRATPEDHVKKNLPEHLPVHRVIQRTKSTAKAATLPLGGRSRAANGPGQRPSPPPRHRKPPPLPLFAPKQPATNQAEPERHPTLVNQNQAATGTSPRG